MIEQQLVPYFFDEIDDKVKTNIKGKLYKGHSDLQTKFPDLPEQTLINIEHLALSKIKPFVQTPLSVAMRENPLEWKKFIQDLNDISNMPDPCMSYLPSTYSQLVEDLIPHQTIYNSNLVTPTQQESDQTTIQNIQNTKKSKTELEDESRLLEEMRINKENDKKMALVIFSKNTLHEAFKLLCKQRSLSCLKVQEAFYLYNIILLVIIKTLSPQHFIQFLSNFLMRAFSLNKHILNNANSTKQQQIAKDVMLKISNDQSILMLVNSTMSPLYQISQIMAYDQDKENRLPTFISSFSNGGNTIIPSSAANITLYKTRLKDLFLQGGWFILMVDHLTDAALDEMLNYYHMLIHDKQIHCNTQFKLWFIVDIQNQIFLHRAFFQKCYQIVIEKQTSFENQIRDLSSGSALEVLSSIKVHPNFVKLFYLILNYQSYLQSRQCLQLQINDLHGAIMENSHKQVHTILFQIVQSHKMSLIYQFVNYLIGHIMYGGQMVSRYDFDFAIGLSEQTFSRLKADSRQIMQFKREIPINIMSFPDFKKLVQISSSEGSSQAIMKTSGRGGGYEEIQKSRIETSILISTKELLTRFLRATGLQGGSIQQNYNIVSDKSLKNINHSLNILLENHDDYETTFTSLLRKSTLFLLQMKDTLTKMVQTQKKQQYYVFLPEFIESELRGYSHMINKLSSTLQDAQQYNDMRFLQQLTQDKFPREWMKEWCIPTNYSLGFANFLKLVKENVQFISLWLRLGRPAQNQVKLSALFNPAAFFYYLRSSFAKTQFGKLKKDDNNGIGMEDVKLDFTFPQFHNYKKRDESQISITGLIICNAVWDQNTGSLASKCDTSNDTSLQCSEINEIQIQASLKHDNNNNNNNNSNNNSNNQIVTQSQQQLQLQNDHQKMLIYKCPVYRINCFDNKPELGGEQILQDDQKNFIIKIPISISVDFDKQECLKRNVAMYCHLNS